MFLLTITYAYDSILTRYAGVVEDIKYVRESKTGYLFVVCTDNDRIYQILSNGLPYFGVGDTVMEYWFDYKMKGIGKKNKLYYYTVVK
jgi:hypothetical protein